MRVPSAFAEQLPEPRTLWVRYSPRSWRGAEGLWFDPITGRLGGSRRGGEAPSVEAIAALDDVVYLPPPAAEERNLRDELAHAAVEAGLIPLIHLDLADSAERIPGPSRLLIDELPRLLNGAGDGAGHLTQLAFGVEVVWSVPAISGLTVGGDLSDRVARRLRELGADSVHVDAPHLEGAELRRVAEATGASGALDLFHAEPADSTSLMRSLHAAGFEVLQSRPARSPTEEAGERRSLAGILGQIADLWLRAGRSPTGAQALFRAAREIDRTAFDLRALAREGNLRVLDWLEPPAESVVEAWLETGSAPLFEELQQEVLGERGAALRNRG